MILWHELEQDFTGHYGYSPSALCFAPGRVNLIGEHIDYAGGSVLPLSITLGVSVAMCARPDGQFRLIAPEIDSAVHEVIADTAGSPALAYVLRLVRLAGLSGADIAVRSDLPVGMGLSSSAAAGIALQGAALAALASDSRPAALELCRNAQLAEHSALGTRCGIMDQYASMFGRRESALLLDTQALTHETLPLGGMAGLSLLVVDSGQNRQLHSSGYNRRQAEMQEALHSLRTQYPRFEGLTRSAAVELMLFAERLPEPLSRRLKHMVSEQRRVLEFCLALANSDHAALGLCLSSSHASLRDDAEVSTPEIDRLVGSLEGSPDCLGARIMGGGFGGSVLALFDGEPDPRRLAAILAGYSADTGLQAGWMQVLPGPGALLHTVGRDIPLAEYLS